MSEKKAYFDYNATTPIAPEVMKTITNSMKYLWGNPSSNYDIGISAKTAIEEARSRVASMIKASSNEIIFTSGGTEANNMLLISVANFYNKRYNSIPHFMTSVIEHDSIKKVLYKLELENKIRFTEININPDTGIIDLNHFQQSLNSDTYFVSIMLANNETGIIQPIKTISKILQDYQEKVNHKRILLHTDAAQGFGKIDISVENLQVDYMTIVGHKYYGPRIGALYVRELYKSNSDIPIEPLLYGGGQEQNLRSGTENTPMIVGLGKASELVTENISKYQSNMLEKCQLLEESLLKRFQTFGCQILSQFPGQLNNNLDLHRLPNTCCVCICTKFDVTGPEILSKCVNLQASVGSACHSSEVSKLDRSNYTGSETLRACGYSLDLCRGAIRLSVGRETTAFEVELIVNDLDLALTNCIDYSSEYSLDSTAKTDTENIGFSEI